MFKSAIIFILAGLAEIGGGYLIWKWIREGGSIWFGLIGGIILCLYGVIATFQVFSSFGRVYAAYGGVFIVMSLLWGWMVDKKAPDIFDFAGAAICLIGVFIILWPRA
ncbi:hypothetical protein COI93_16445 [Bacillus cereus]|uniref:Uncharacterized protein n=1 Tax=Bacillus cereus TaxID=1396 RepID=A0A2B0LV14_BACCE|nr:hypothetical protein COI93_16445 [Bacillus cereus]